MTTSLTTNITTNCSVLFHHNTNKMKKHHGNNIVGLWCYAIWHNITGGVSTCYTGEWALGACEVSHPLNYQKLNTVPESKRHWVVFIFWKWAGVRLIRWNNVRFLYVFIYWFISELDRIGENLNFQRNSKEMKLREILLLHVLKWSWCENHDFKITIFLCCEP